MKRISILAAAAGLVVTPAFGAWAAYAGTGGDDTSAAHVRVHARHGADDAPGHQRHSAEPEPGDDRGARHHGGGSDDGGHHGGHHRGDG